MEGQEERPKTPRDFESPTFPEASRGQSEANRGQPTPHGAVPTGPTGPPLRSIRPFRPWGSGTPRREAGLGWFDGPGGVDPIDREGPVVLPVRAPGPSPEKMVGVDLGGLSTEPEEMGQEP